VEIKFYNIFNFLSQLKFQALIDANSIMLVFVVVTHAMLIVPMIVASFVQHFKWELGPKEIEILNSKIEDVVYLSTHKLHPLQCIITPRTSQRLP
jgi:diacylglycerol kinase